MRIISIDVGMKNLAYCILNIPVEANAAASAALSAHPAKSSTSSFSQESLDELMKNITIERWDVIDLRFEPTAIIPAPAAKLLCNNDSKQAKYMYIPSSDKTKSLDTPKLYCLKCSEKSKYKIPSREIMPIKRNFALLQKKKMDELIDIHNMVVATSAASTATDDNNKKIRKADKIKDIELVLSRDYLELIDDYKYAAATAASASSACDDGDDEPSTQNIVLGTKKTKVNYTYAHDLDMITYGRNLMKHMDAILYPAPASALSSPVSALSSPASALSSPPRIDMMIIENQISTIATRMKTLQGMITQYFIMKNVPQIEFISASCKLKLFTDSMLDVSKYVDATTYGDRKKAGITICRALGEMSPPPPASTNYATWMPMFEKHKKKDDLADCFLQCLWRVHLLMGV
jgi:hypothetical protein